MSEASSASKMKSPVLERLEAAKAAREARNPDEIKAALDARLAAAEERHDKTMDAIRERGKGEVEKAKSLAATHKSGSESARSAEGGASAAAAATETKKE